MKSCEYGPFGRVIESIQPPGVMLVMGEAIKIQEIAKRFAGACELLGAQILTKPDGSWTKNLLPKPARMLFPGAPLIVVCASDVPTSDQARFDTIIGVNPNGSWRVVKGSPMAYHESVR